MAVSPAALTQACGEGSQSGLSSFPGSSWTVVFCKHGTASGRCFVISSLRLSVILLENFIRLNVCFTLSVGSR